MRGAPALRAVPPAPATAAMSHPRVEPGSRDLCAGIVRVRFEVDQDGKFMECWASMKSTKGVEFFTPVPTEKSFTRTISSEYRCSPHLAPVPLRPARRLRSHPTASPISPGPECWGPAQLVDCWATVSLHPGRVLGTWRRHASRSRTTCLRSGRTSCLPEHVPHILAHCHHSAATGLAGAAKKTDWARDAPFSHVPPCILVHPASCAACTIAWPPYGTAHDDGRRMMDDSLFIGTHTELTDR